ncbi:LD-carboxypeptidase [Paenalcaligenes sp.]|uniref:LD-carboxypeptidase n=1 Tax=Paenalcaligenes sp. TaxID=1966342 RepID=UPI00260BEA1B|nr:LD-carboxypeptidase [Paenalcaligenes sp.]
MKTESITQKGEQASCHAATPEGIYIISSSSAVEDASQLHWAQQHLRALGWQVQLDGDALAVHQRFAGSDAQRLAAIERALNQPHDVVLSSRGGYGLSRLLPFIDWKAVAQSGKRFVGHSDFTAFNLALLAQTGAISYAGPCAAFDFGVEQPDDLTLDLFHEAMTNQLEVLSFEAEGSDAVDTRGVLWGGNLAMLCSLLGTPYFPQVSDGILFLEDVGEHPYRIERYLNQLWQAGVLAQQQAIILGQFTGYHLAEHDRGYDIQTVIQWLRQTVKKPVVLNLPYGHVPLKATLPIGKKIGVATEDDMAYLLIEEHHHE